MDFRTFFACTKNEVFKYPKTMPWNTEKKLNAKDKYICYFYKESQIFQFIWSHVLPKTNAEDMESQSAQHLWSNCNSLVLRVKSSSSNRDGFFSNKYNCCGHPVFENQKYYVIQKLSSLYQFILEIQQILESHDLKGHANIWPRPPNNF